MTLFQCVISLVYINKYLIQGLLSYDHNILEDFGIQYGCLSNYPLYESMKDIM